MYSLRSEITQRLLPAEFDNVYCAHCQNAYFSHNLYSGAKFNIFDIKSAKMNSSHFHNFVQKHTQILEAAHISYFVHSKLLNPEIQLQNFCFCIRYHFSKNWLIHSTYFFTIFPVKPLWRTKTYITSSTVKNMS